MSVDPTPSSSIDEKREPIAAPDVEAGHLGRTDSQIEADGGGACPAVLVDTGSGLTSCHLQRYNSSALTLPPLD